jgi:hypothetical protein
VSKCIICRERPAQVPDRERMGRPIKRVCRQCHVVRLQQDLKQILDEHTRKRMNEKEAHQKIEIPQNKT